MPGGPLLMRILRQPSELHAWREQIPSSQAMVLVPTMGALHLGHRSLLRLAAQGGGQMLATIFVNPLQFERADDLKTYPHDLEADLALLEASGAAAVYMPQRDDMYSDGFQVSIDPGPAAERFEGAARPGHFAGMLTVVHKLFQRCRPQHAWFGEKDAQQLFLVRRMVQDLDLPVEIHACPIFREDDGLAFSSRNRKLDSASRGHALVLVRALRAAEAAFVAGCRDPQLLEQAMSACFADSPAQLAYATVVSDQDFQQATTEGKGPWRAIVAARLADVHLLDNLRLGPI